MTGIGWLMTIILGGLAGWIAEKIMKFDTGLLMNIVLGIVGSFVGGMLGYLLFHKDADDGFLQPSGIIGSIIGAVIVVLAVGMLTSRTRTGSGSI